MSNVCTAWWTPEALCRALWAVSETFLWVGATNCPAGGPVSTNASATGRHFFGGWLLSNGIRMNARNQGFPAEYYSGVK